MVEKMRPQVYANGLGQDFVHNPYLSSPCTAALKVGFPRITIPTKPTCDLLCSSVLSCMTQQAVFGMLPKQQVHLETLGEPLIMFDPFPPISTLLR